MITTIEKEIKFLRPFEELLYNNYRYLVFYGGRNSGKSFHAAAALLTRGREKKLRILCTREIQNTIKDSVHKLLADIIDNEKMFDYIVTEKAIVNSRTGTEFIFKGLRLNIVEIKSTEGIDICWVEEAQSITQKSLDILTPTIRKPGSQIILTFNRYTDLDPVFVNFVQNPPPGTHIKKVNFDVLEDSGLLSNVAKMEIEKDKDKPEIYAHKWLGEPIGQGEFATIPRTKLLEAMHREIEGEGQIEVGVDVARMGVDRTVFWKRQGLKTIEFDIHNKLKIPQICDALENFINFDKTVTLKVDDTGVGGGVTDEMEKRGYNVIAINFGGSPQDKDKYPNLISEAWFRFAENIEQMQLPYNSELLLELSTRQWGQDNRGRRCIEAKDSYKKRGFRSPDLADACIICYYEKNLMQPEDIDIL